MSVGSVAWCHSRTTLMTSLQIPASSPVTHAFSHDPRCDAKAGLPEYWARFDEYGPEYWARFDIIALMKLLRSLLKLLRCSRGSERRQALPRPLRWEEACLLAAAVAAQVCMVPTARFRAPHLSVRLDQVEPGSHRQCPNHLSCQHGAPSPPQLAALHPQSMRRHSCQLYSGIYVLMSPHMFRDALFVDVCTMPHWLHLRVLVRLNAESRCNNEQSICAMLL